MRERRSWPSSSQASQLASGAMRARVRVRRQRGAPSRGPAGGGGEVPAGLDPGRAAAAGGEEERERGLRRVQRAAFGGEVQAADGEERRGRGQVGHHQRHLARPQRLLGGPEALGRLARAGEDEAGGVEEGAEAVPERAARRTRRAAARAPGR